MASRSRCASRISRSSPYGQHRNCAHSPPRIRVCPPSPPYAIKFLIHREIVEAQFVFELVSHGNPGWAGADNDGIWSACVLRHSV